MDDILYTRIALRETLHFSIRMDSDCRGGMLPLFFFFCVGLYFYVNNSDIKLLIERQHQQPSFLSVQRKYENKSNLHETDPRMIIRSGLWKITQIYGMAICWSSSDSAQM